MAAEGVTSTEYIKHHLTNLTFGKHADGSWGFAHNVDEIRAMGFWGIQVDSIGWSVFLGLVFLVLVIWANRYIKVGPNQVLIVSGKRHRDEAGGLSGFRVVKGGGTFIWPVVEKYDILSLELMTIDVRTPEVYTITGVPIRVDGVAQVKVDGTEISIRTASERFLSMGNELWPVMRLPEFARYLEGAPPAGAAA